MQHEAKEPDNAALIDEEQPAAPPPPAEARSRHDFTSQYIATGIILAILLIVWLCVSTPSDPKYPPARALAFAFLTTQLVRISFAIFIAHRVNRYGAVSGWLLFIYIIYLVGCFGVFIAFNVLVYIAMDGHEASSYDFLMLFTVCFGYGMYFAVIAVIVCIVPIFLCMLCCCRASLTSSMRGWKPTSESILSRLTRTKFRADTHEAMQECIICSVEFAEGDNLITLNCDARHYFHAGCIEQWLKQNGICPICRTPAAAQ